ncbi:hypothetical protein ACFUOZ_13950 [Paenarthrobacter sp. NPDC057355]|uniref:hypothetical protein n=1 Tax=Paenarthrobacter sp. NPDC057355 TaxID=3346105 RepID=UPI00364564FB
MTTLHRAGLSSGSEAAYPTDRIWELPLSAGSTAVLSCTSTGVCGAELRWAFTFNVSLLTVVIPLFLLDAVPGILLRLNGQLLDHVMPTQAMAPWFARSDKREARGFDELTDEQLEELNAQHLNRR